jgi:hypothetical protein
MSVRYRVYNAFWSQLRRGAESVIRPVWISQVTYEIVGNFYEVKST